jgi:RNA polymerase primary sigma factor
MGSHESWNADALGDYLIAISAYPILTYEESTDMFKAYEAGRAAWDKLNAEKSRNPELEAVFLEGLQAREVLITSNLRLVVSIAKRYPTSPNVEFIDYIQQGNIALEHAIEKFQWRKGFYFSTYATYWLRQAMARLCDTERYAIHLPAAEAQKVKSDLADGVDPDSLTDASLSVYRVTNMVSLNKESTNREDSELQDFLPDDTVDIAEEATENVMTERVLSCLDWLTEKEQYIIRSYFGINAQQKTLTEIGAELGVVHTSVANYRNRAIAKLQAMLVAAS